MREPDFNLGIGGGSQGEQTGRMLIELEKVIDSVKPDCVLVYGDTNSTLAGALAAAKAGIPLAHVEAGLRSYNRAMPEEINRVICDHISDLLLCPTTAAVENLTKEGITKGVHHVGDVMYDALLKDLEPARKKSQIISKLGLKKGGYALATVHRAANTDDPVRMRAILEGLASLDIRVVFPAHPRTHKRIDEWNLQGSIGNILMIEPVGRFDMLLLQANANCILTDSGGIQKEAYWAGVRCMTLREETEWVETVDAGWNKLVGTDPQTIRSVFESWIPTGARKPLYGDGHASEKICSILSSYLI
jgi:UDP-GlcNAc3NAcA epimerase